MSQSNIWKSIKRVDSAEGNVCKFVFANDNAVAESVLYRYPTYADRTVICCSTQSGCQIGWRPHRLRLRKMPSGTNLRVRMDPFNSNGDCLAQK